MTISSRTPEGQPSTCPLCQARVVVEPSLLIGDATCPRCGQLLWFIQIPGEIRFFDAKGNRTQKARIVDDLASQLGIDPAEVVNNPSLWNELEKDSLDLVELVMGLEDQFDRP